MKENEKENDPYDENNPDNPAKVNANQTMKKRNTKHKGPYILGATLGEGAFAKVKVATHIHTQEKVAIKILDKEKMVDDEEDIKRVQKEINILKKLKHKNIIQLYEVMESRKNLYIVMEYCEGKELFDYIVMRKRLCDLEACKFFQDIIDGVDYLHSQSVVHRDLKPENLLLDYKRNIKISDFGLSTPYYKGSMLSTPCGTPSYAPPEMLIGEDYHGLYSDVWSCGIILYAMLCGFLPFAESKEDIICQKFLDNDYEMPDYLSPYAVDLLSNMLKVDIQERFDLEKIKSHPWFNLTKPTLRPGLSIGHQKIPIDEKIIELVEDFGFDKDKCRISLINNKYDSVTSVYYLCLKKFIKQGGVSVSDLFSDEYLKFVNNSENKSLFGVGSSHENTNNTLNTHRLLSPDRLSHVSTLRRNNKEDKKEEIKLSVNLNLNLNLNTTNNINFTPDANGKTGKNEKISKTGKNSILVSPNTEKTNPIAHQAATPNTQTTNIPPCHKTSSSIQINHINGKFSNNPNPSKLKEKVKEYSSSIASPNSIREISFTNANSNKNSFLSPTSVNKNNTFKKEKTASFNKLTLVKPVVNNPNPNINNNNNDKKLKTCIIEKSKNLINNSHTCTISNTSSTCTNQKSNSIKNNKQTKPYNTSSFISHSGSFNNLTLNLDKDSNTNTGNFSNILSPKILEEDLNEDEKSKIRNLKNSGKMVLELIASKILKNNNYNVTLKKDKSMNKKSPNSGKSNNNSFLHNRSTSLIADSSNTNLTNITSMSNSQPSNKKLTKGKIKSCDNSGNQFGLFIGVVNQELKKYYETQNPDLLFDEADKEGDSILINPEILNNNMNSQFIHDIVKKDPYTLKNTKYKKKFNNFNKAKKNYSESFVKVKKNYEVEREKDFTRSRDKKDKSCKDLMKNNKFLDISATYDTELDSRNESSVDLSMTRQSNLRNISFSPDVSIQNKRTSYTQSILEKTKKEINLNLNSSSPLASGKNLITVNKLKQAAASIGVISEDEEFNNCKKENSKEKKNLNHPVVAPPNSYNKDTSTDKKTYKGLRNAKLSEKRVTINLGKEKNVKNKKNLKIIDSSDNAGTTPGSSVFSPIKSYNKNLFSSKNSNIQGAVGNKKNSIKTNSTLPIVELSNDKEKQKQNKNEQNMNKQPETKEVTNFVDNLNISPILHPTAADLPHSSEINSKEFSKNDQKNNEKVSKHKKTASAFELNSEILNEKNTEIPITKSKHQRNRSQINELEGVLKKPTTSRNENSSFIIRNSNCSNDASLINCINKNDGNIFFTINKGSLLIPNLANLSNLNTKNNKSSYKNENNNHFSNECHTERGGEKNKIKSIIEDFIHRPAYTNRSDKTANTSIFQIFKDSDVIKLHTGPIDFHCVTYVQPRQIIERLSEIILRKKIKFAKTVPYILKCSKNGIRFDIEILRLEDSEQESKIFYIKFKMGSRVINLGDYSNYRKIIQDIMYKFSQNY